MMKHSSVSRARHGFTLVEIMVVVLIIGMLLAIAAPVFARAREHSKSRACQFNLKEIMCAKERWAMDNNRGPLDTPTMEQLAVPGVYMKGTPACPSGGIYTVNRLDQFPTCAIGGPTDDPDAHIIP